MPLNPQQLEQLRDLIGGEREAAFDRDSLEQMVQFKLGKNLFAIVEKDKPLKTIAFALIQVAEQEGWTEALVRATCLSRPNNARVQEWARDHFPQALTLEESAQQVEKVTRGLSALSTLLQRLARPEVGVIVGEFRADFEVTREKADALARYKALHDFLHQLGVKYLRAMADAAKLWRQEASQLESLDSYSLQLRADAQRARAITASLKNPRVEEDWIDSLEQASSLVAQGVERSEDAPIARGIETLRRVLKEEPVRINALLCSFAGDLRLERFIHAMRRIGAALGGVDIPADDPARLDFESGLTSLLRLHPRLNGLVEEHYEWQWLDKEFSAADAIPGRTPEERFPRWEKFASRLGGLCALSSTRDWSVALAAALEAVRDAGKLNDAVQFGRRYNKFRTIAADRFFNVDAELSDLTVQLGRIIQPLNQLLRLATHDVP